MSEQKLEDRFPSMRDYSLHDTWPPETVAMKVEDEEPPADDGSGDEPSPPQAPVVPTVMPQEALRQAEAALDAARHEQRLARTALTSARQNTAKRLADFNQATPTITPEENVRQWIAANNAARAERAARNGGNYQPTVTATAKAMAGGGHGNDIRTLRGGGAAYRRGPGGVQAYTKAQALTVNAQRAREAVPKVPSEK